MPGRLFKKNPAPLGKTRWGKLLFFLSLIRQFYFVTEDTQINLRVGKKRHFKLRANACVRGYDFSFQVFVLIFNFC